MGAFLTTRDAPYYIGQQGNAD